MRRAVIAVSAVFGCLTLTDGCTNSDSGSNGGSGGRGSGGASGAVTTGTGGAGGSGSGSGGAIGTGGSSSGGASGTGGAGLPTDGAADGGGTPDPDAATSGACGGLFCEDFESGQIDTAKWSTPTANGGMFMLQQKIVAHGKYAVQFHGGPNPGQNDYAYLIWKNAPAAMAKHNFGRAYFYITPKPHDIDMGLIYGGTAGFPKPTYLSIANHSTGWQLGFIKLSGSPGGEVQAYPKPDIPVAVWTCLEWEFNDQPTSINLWADGQVVGSLTNQKIDYPGGHVPGTPLYNGMNSDLIGAFTDIGIGYYDWHPQGRPAFDIYYDDIVLGTTRPGCLP